jgi:hypothetical protein
MNIAIVITIMMLIILTIIIVVYNYQKPDDTKKQSGSGDSGTPSSGSGSGGDSGSGSSSDNKPDPGPSPNPPSPPSPSSPTVPTKLNITDTSTQPINTLYVYQEAGNNPPPGFSFTFTIMKGFDIGVVNSQKELDVEINTWIQNVKKVTATIGGKLPDFKYVAITKTGRTVGKYYIALGVDYPKADGFQISPVDSAALVINNNLVSGYKCCEKNNEVLDDSGNPRPEHVFNKRGGCTWVIYEF